MLTNIAFFAPFWVWVPLGAAQVVMLFGVGSPWWFRWLPALLYLSSFLPMLIALLLSAREE
jgi:hypothetical protein